MWMMNTPKSSTTHFMPYEVTFNKKPNLGIDKAFNQLVGDEKMKCSQLQLMLDQDQSQVTDKGRVEDKDKDKDEDTNKKKKYQGNFFQYLNRVWYSK